MLHTGLTHAVVQDSPEEEEGAATAPGQEHKGPATRRASRLADAFDRLSSRVQAGGLACGVTLTALLCASLMPANDTALILLVQALVSCVQAVGASAFFDLDTPGGNGPSQLEWLARQVRWTSRVGCVAKVFSQVGTFKCLRESTSLEVMSSAGPQCWQGSRRCRRLAACCCPAGSVRRTVPRSAQPQRGAAAPPKGAQSSGSSDGRLGIFCCVVDRSRPGAWSKRTLTADERQVAGLQCICRDMFSLLPA
jgi:hypothetical protein